VAQQFSLWIRKADIAETTRATRQHTWRAHVAAKWGDLQLTKVSPPEIKAWVADLVDAGTGVPTIENALGVLRMVLKDAVEDGRLIRNPCEGINAPKRQHRSRAYLTHQQVEQLAMAAGDVDSLVVRLLAYTGVRWGELAALTVSSVDVLRRRIQISQAVAEADGRLEWKSPKDHERRSVPFLRSLRMTSVSRCSARAERICCSQRPRVGRSGFLTGGPACSTRPATR
jgi:integrase